VADDLRGAAAPTAGTLVEAVNVAARPGAGPAGRDCVELDSKASRLAYRHAGLPAVGWTLTLWAQPLNVPPWIGTVALCGSGPPSPPPTINLWIEAGRMHAILATDRATWHRTGSVAVEPGRWLHVAVVKSGDTLALYVDGRLRGTALVPRAVLSPTDVLILGGSPQGNPPPFQARFAEVRLVDRALPAEEIARRYRADRPAE
jgi:hypothetical protein